MKASKGKSQAPSGRAEPMSVLAPSPLHERKAPTNKDTKLQDASPQRRPLQPKPSSPSLGTMHSIATAVDTASDASLSTASPVLPCKQDGTSWTKGIPTFRSRDSRVTPPQADGKGEEIRSTSATVATATASSSFFPGHGPQRRTPSQQMQGLRHHAWGDTPSSPTTPTTILEEITEGSPVSVFSKHASSAFPRGGGKGAESRVSSIASPLCDDTLATTATTVASTDKATVDDSQASIPTCISERRPTPPTAAAEAAAPERPQPMSVTAAFVEPSSATALDNPIASTVLTELSLRTMPSTEMSRTVADGQLAMDAAVAAVARQIPHAPVEACVARSPRNAFVMAAMAASGEGFSRSIAELMDYHDAESGSTSAIPFPHPPGSRASTHTTRNTSQMVSTVSLTSQGTLLGPANSTDPSTTSHTSMARGGARSSEPSPKATGVARLREKKGSHTAHRNSKAATAVPDSSSSFLTTETAPRPGKTLGIPSGVSLRKPLPLAPMHPSQDQEPIKEAKDAAAVMSAGNVNRKGERLPQGNPTVLKGSSPSPAFPSSGVCGEVRDEVEDAVGAEAGNSQGSSHHDSVDHADKASVVTDSCISECSSATAYDGSRQASPTTSGRPFSSKNPQWCSIARSPGQSSEHHGARGRFVSNASVMSSVQLANSLVLALTQEETESGKPPEPILMTAVSVQSGHLEPLRGVHGGKREGIQYRATFRGFIEGSTNDIPEEVDNGEDGERQSSVGRRLGHPASPLSMGSSNASCSTAPDARDAVAEQFLRNLALRRAGRPSVSVGGGDGEESVTEADVEELDGDAEDDDSHGFQDQRTTSSEDAGSPTAATRTRPAKPKSYVTRLRRKVSVHYPPQQGGLARVRLLSLMSDASGGRKGGRRSVSIICDAVPEELDPAMDSLVSPGSSLSAAIKAVGSTSAPHSHHAGAHGQGVRQHLHLQLSPTSSRPSHTASFRKHEPQRSHVGRRRMKGKRQVLTPMSVNPHSSHTSHTSHERTLSPRSPSAQTMVTILRTVSGTRWPHTNPGASSHHRLRSLSPTFPTGGGGAITSVDADMLSSAVSEASIATSAQFFGANSSSLTVGTGSSTTWHQIDTQSNSRTSGQGHLPRFVSHTSIASASGSGGSHAVSTSTAASTTAVTNTLMPRCPGALDRAAAASQVYGSHDFLCSVANSTGATPNLSAAVSVSVVATTAVFDGRAPAATVASERVSKRPMTATHSQAGDDIPSHSTIKTMASARSSAAPTRRQQSAGASVISVAAAPVEEEEGASIVESSSSTMQSIAEDLPSEGGIC